MDAKRVTKPSDKNTPSKSSPRQILIDAGLIFLVGLAVLSYRFPILSGSLYSTRPIYNFGTAQGGAEMHARFVVRNLHPWSVTLTQLKGSCGCTTPIADRPFPARIAPFEVVTVNAVLDTTYQSGSIHKPISLITDHDPVGMQLAIEGTVSPRKEEKG